MEAKVWILKLQAKALDKEEVEVDRVCNIRCGLRWCQHLRCWYRGTLLSPKTVHKQMDVSTHSVTRNRQSHGITSSDSPVLFNIAQDMCSQRRAHETRNSQMCRGGQGEKVCNCLAHGSAADLEPKWQHVVVLLDAVHVAHCNITRL